MENTRVKVEIWEETPMDYPAVYTVNNLAFGQKEEANLVDRLRGSEAFIPQLSLVAKYQDKVVGYVLFTKIEIVSEESKTESLALAPVAVIPEMQNKGIGNQLITFALDTAKTMGYKSVVVLGHEHYYPRFGFESTSKWNIRPPFDVPPPVFMGLELVRDALKGVKGIVKYSPEFGI